MRKVVFAGVLLGLASCAASEERRDRERVITNLTPRYGEFIWRVSERRRDGRENRQCFEVPHGGRVLYWPSKHTVAFGLTQGDSRKTFTAFIPVKRQHEIKFMWNQISETISLMVDGAPPQKFQTEPLSVKPVECPFKEGEEHRA